MKNPDLMKLRSDCSLMELRGRYLLIRPGGKTLQVNESFAWLWNVASKGLFSAKSLTDAICAEYESTPEEAAEQVRQTLELWRQLDVIAD